MWDWHLHRSIITNERSTQIYIFIRVADVEEARQWREDGYPSLDRNHYLAVEKSNASEEPVHVLIDVESPEKASMWFYSTASKSDMVLTGPTSDLEAMETNEREGVIYIKEFFDAWEVDQPAQQRDTPKKPARNYDSGLEP
jgi:hypothetical protein